MRKVIVGLFVAAIFGITTTPALAEDGDQYTQHESDLIAAMIKALDQVNTMGYVSTSCGKHYPEYANSIAAALDDWRSRNAATLAVIDAHYADFSRWAAARQQSTEEQVRSDAQGDFDKLAEQIDQDIAKKNPDMTEICRGFAAKLSDGEWADLNAGLSDELATLQDGFPKPE